MSVGIRSRIKPTNAALAARQERRDNRKSDARTIASGARHALNDARMCDAGAQFGTVPRLGTDLQTFDKFGSQVANGATIGEKLYLSALEVRDMVARLNSESGTETQK